jgi:hypothetical protein
MLSSQVQNLSLLLYFTSKKTVKPSNSQIKSISQKIENLKFVSKSL